MSLVASRYAEGLFSLALDKHVVKEYKEDLNVVKQSFSSVENIEEFFASEKVKASDKKEVIKNALGESINKDVLNFLCLLVDKKRIVYYKDIISEYNHLANGELKIKEGVIESARPLDKDKIKELEKVLAKDDEVVELRPKINKELISGFKIRFENEVIDASMKEKIDKMHDLLSK